MQITTIHYQKLINLGDYENERIGAWANVDEGETPEAALAALADWVEDQGAQRGRGKVELDEVRNLIEDRRSVLNGMTRELKEMRETWRKARAFLDKVGLEVPRTYISDDDMPF